jgi:hypothetical protein
MWFWPVTEMNELVLDYVFFLILRALNMSSLIPGVHVPQVEFH